MRGENATAAYESYRAARGLDRSLLGRYLDFLGRTVTFQWGTSVTWGRSVAGLVAERGLVTAAYVLPSLLVSTLLGTVTGLYLAVRESRVVDSLVSGVTYAGYGVPNFWLALVLAALLSELSFVESGFVPGRGLLAPGNVAVLAVTAAALSTTLFTIQLRYVRSEVGAGLREEFVKLVRAKGGGRWHEARHALRYAAVPIVSLPFTEFLAVLFLSVFVLEAALGVTGLGELLFTAIKRRDIPVVMACSIVPVTVGVYGNFLHDVLHAVLEPRSELG